MFDAASHSLSRLLFRAVLPGVLPFCLLSSRSTGPAVVTNINGVLVTAGDVAVLQGSDWFTDSVLNAYTSQGEVVVRNVVGGSGLRNLLVRSWRTPMLVFHPKCCLSAAWSLLYEGAALVSEISSPYLLTQNSAVRHVVRSYADMSKAVMAADRGAKPPNRPFIPYSTPATARVPPACQKSNEKLPP